MDQQHAELQHLMIRYDEKLIVMVERLKSGMLEADMRAIQKQWETKMDQQLVELKKTVEKYGEKLIELDKRLKTCVFVLSDTF